MREVMCKEKIKISNEEYTALRNEIVSTLEQQRNVWIAMYTIYVALFVIAIEYSYKLLLVTFVVLIPFQFIINSQNWSVQKISTYIRCFFEQETGEFHWEGLHMYSVYKEYYKKYGDSKLLNYTGSTQLGMLSYIMFCGYLIYECYSSNVLNIFNVFLLCVATLLLIVTIIINKGFKRENAGELEKVMSQYKKCIIEKTRNDKQIK